MRPTNFYVLFLALPALSNLGCQNLSADVDFSDELADSVVAEEYLWPDAKMTLLVDVDSYEGSASEIEAFVAEIDSTLAILNEQTPLTLRRIASSQQALEEDFIEVAYAKNDRDRTFPGRLAELASKLDHRIIANKDSFKHQLGHATGLMHPHQRLDSKDFVDVFPNNVDFDSLFGNYLATFNLDIRLPEPGIIAKLFLDVAPYDRSLGLIGPYDFDSVMHYHSFEMARAPSKVPSRIYTTLLRSAELSEPAEGYDDITSSQNFDGRFGQHDKRLFDKTMLERGIFPMRIPRYSLWNYSVLSVLYCRKHPEPRNFGQYPDLRDDAPDKCWNQSVQRNLRRYDDWVINNDQRYLSDDPEELRGNPRVSYAEYNERYTPDSGDVAAD